MQSTRLLITAPLLTFCILLGLGVQTALRPGPANAEPYHRRIREKANEFPIQFGNWIGRQVPVPKEARDLLHPNVIISRTYFNTRTGRQVSFLLVHCQDTRDMSGHYPPICYPGQGWTQSTADAHQYDVDGLMVNETAYTFHRVGAEMVVHNFLILPDGRIVPNMAGLNTLTKHRGQRFYGAGQIQIILEPNLTESEQQQVIEDFIRAVRPVLAEIMAGGLS